MQRPFPGYWFPVLRLRSRSTSRAPCQPTHHPRRRQEPREWIMPDVFENSNVCSGQTGPYLTGCCIRDATSTQRWCEPCAGATARGGLTAFFLVFSLAQLSKHRRGSIGLLPTQLCVRKLELQPAAAFDFRFMRQHSRQGQPAKFVFRKPFFGKFGLVV